MRDHSAQRGDHHQPGAGGLAGPGPPDRRGRAEPGRGRRVRRATCWPRSRPRGRGGSAGRSGSCWTGWTATRWRCGSPCPAWTPPTRPTCWPRCAAPPPCRPRTTRARAGPSSLPACITYSYAHLAGQTRRLLPAVSLFHGVADEDLLMALLRRRGGAGPVRRGQQAGVDGGAGGRGPGRAAHRPRRGHVPDPPGPARLPRRRMARRGPRRLRPGAGGVRAGPVHRLRRVQPVADRADRIRGRRPRLRHHRAAAADPGRDARPRPGPPRVGRRRAVSSGRWMRTGTPAASAGKPPPGPTASWTPPPAPARHPPRDPPARCGCTPPSTRPPGRRTPGSRTRPGRPTGRPWPTCRTSPKPTGPAATSPSSTTSSA